MNPCMLLLHEGYDYRIFGGRNRVEPEVTEGENITIMYRRKGPGLTGGDRRGSPILCLTSVLIWLR